MGKSIFLSKTFWVNLLAIVFMVINYFYPLVVLSPELQAIILGVINIILRLVTGQPIDWGTDKHRGKAW